MNEKKKLTMPQMTILSFGPFVLIWVFLVVLGVRLEHGSEVGVVGVDGVCG
jgi:hypothetical protein